MKSRTYRMVQQIIQEIPALNFLKMRGKMERGKERVEGEWMTYKDRFVAHNVRGEEGLKRWRKWRFRLNHCREMNESTRKGERVPLGVWKSSGSFLAVKLRETISWSSVIRWALSEGAEGNLRTLFARVFLFSFLVVEIFFQLKKYNESL